MKPLAILGIILILLGAAALYYRGIPYTKKEEVLKVGSVRAQMETKELYPVSPVVSGLVVVGGIALVIVGLRKRA